MPSEWHALIAFGIFATLYVVLLFKNKLPSAHSIQELLAALNSRGGNILVLAAFSVYFFHDSVRMFYFVIDAAINGKLTADNAFAAMGLQFLTTTAFGGFSGALIKTMTGDTSKGRIGDTGTERQVTSRAAPKSSADAGSGEPATQP